MLGNIIKELRINKGITQKELASALRVSHQAVSLWERDKADPDIINIKELSKYFDVTTDYQLAMETDFSTKKY